MVQPLWNTLAVSQKDTELPHDPASPLLETVQEKLEPRPAKVLARERSLQHHS